MLWLLRISQNYMDLLEIWFATACGDGMLLVWIATGFGGSIWFPWKYENYPLGLDTISRGFLCGNVIHVPALVIVCWNCLLLHMKLLILILFVIAGSRSHRHHNGIGRQGHWVSVILYQFIYIHLLHILGHYPRQLIAFFLVSLLIPQMPTALNSSAVDIYSLCVSAVCKQWSLHPLVFPAPPRICHINTCVCWHGASVLLMHFHWICDAEIQKEESMMKKVAIAQGWAFTSLEVNRCIEFYSHFLKWSRLHHLFVCIICNSPFYPFCFFYLHNCDEVFIWHQICDRSSIFQRFHHEQGLCRCF